MAVFIQPIWRALDPLFERQVWLLPVLFLPGSVDQYVALKVSSLSYLVVTDHFQWPKQTRLMKVLFHLVLPIERSVFVRFKFLPQAISHSDLFMSTHFLGDNSSTMFSGCFARATYLPRSQQL
jgi:hypothetical protein